MKCLTIPFNDKTLNIDIQYYIEEYIEKHPFIKSSTYKKLRLMKDKNLLKIKIVEEKLNSLKLDKQKLNEKLDKQKRDNNLHLLELKKLFNL